MTVAELVQHAEGPVVCRLAVNFPLTMEAPTRPARPAKLNAKGTFFDVCEPRCLCSKNNSSDTR
jgi:hypothetical protein